jgi:hypothetical protein
MSILTRRTRVVSFRLSEEEYKDLMSLCLTQGSRNLSDFARLATFSQFANSSTHGQADSVQQIYRKLGALDREVKRLARLIDGSDAESAPTLEPVESAQAS